MTVSWVIDREPTLKFSVNMVPSHLETGILVGRFGFNPSKVSSGSDLIANPALIRSSDRLPTLAGDMPVIAGDTGYEVRSSCSFRIMPIALGGTLEMRQPKYTGLLTCCCKR